MDMVPVSDAEPRAPFGASPATAGGSSAGLIPSCLKKAGPKSPQVRGITWSEELAVAQDGVVRVSPMEFGRTLGELAEEVVVVNHGTPAVVDDYYAESFRRALALKEKEKSIIADAWEVAKKTREESIVYSNPAAFMAEIRRDAEADLEREREQLLEGHDVHHEILFIQAFLYALSNV